MEEQNLLAPEEKQFATFYKRSVFWINHRRTIRGIALGIFLCVDLLLLGSSAYAFFDFGINDYFTERAMVGGIVEGVGHFHTVSRPRAAASLTVAGTDVFGIDATRADFYAELTNPNVDWEASFDYAFTYGEGTTDVQKGFILPSELRKPIVALGVTVGTVPRSATLQISNIVWTRVNHHAIGDYAAWQGERLNFVTSDVSFDRSVTLGTSTIGRTQFTVQNASAYGFWDPLFTVVLYRNDHPVGVTTVSTPSLAGGESREITVNWFGTVPQANATLIVPNMDIFDPTIYMPLHGELVPDVRERVKSKR